VSPLYVDVNYNAAKYGGGVLKATSTRANGTAMLPLQITIVKTLLFHLHATLQFSVRT